MDLRIGEAGNFCNFAFHDAHVFEYVMDLEQKGLKTQAWQAWGKSASHFQSWKVRSLHSRCMYISLYVYVYGCGYNSKHFQAYHLSNHIMFELTLQWSMGLSQELHEKESKWSTWTRCWLRWPGISPAPNSMWFCQKCQEVFVKQKRFGWS